MSKQGQPTAAAWDTWIQRHHGSILQGAGWADFLAQQGHTLFYESAKNYAWLAQQQEVPSGHYWYVPYGPIIATEADSIEALDSLTRAAREHGALFVRAEPRGLDANYLRERLRSEGWREVGEWQPAHTQVIDLTETEEQLRHGLRSGHRNAINGAARRGISVRSTTDPAEIKLLTAMMADTSKGRFIAHHAAYYEQLAQVLMPTGLARLYVAEVAGKPVASALAFDYAGVRGYAHAAAFAEGRKLQAPAVLVWQMVLDAKAAKMRQFDLWGIAPPDQPNHPWAGFSAFKAGFGGKVVSYVGTWERPLRTARYQAYRLVKMVRGR